MQGYVPPFHKSRNKDTAPESQASSTGPKKHKKKLLIIIAVAIVLLFSSCVAALSGEDDPSTPAAASTPAISSEESNNEKTGANTTEMVDRIARQAKDDAEKASEKDLNNAYAFICKNYKNCFDSSETMEQMMYNGWLLEYAYEGDSDKNDYYHLGQDAEQLVKYVYRGEEKPEDQATKENLSQIETSIGKIKAAAAEEEKSKKSEATSSEADTKTTPSTDTPKKTTASTDTPKKTPPSTDTDTKKKTTSSTSTDTKKKTTTSTDTSSNQQTTTPATTQKADNEARVWIPTNGGKKYHSRSGCSNMKNPQEVTISEAKNRGFTPCGRCY